MQNVPKSANIIAKLILVFLWGITLDCCLPLLADDATGGTASPQVTATTPAAPQPSGTAQLAIEPAIGTTVVDGNFRRYEQYETPSDGLYLNRFDLSMATASDGAVLDLLGHDVGKSSEGESLWAAAGYGTVVVEGLRRNSTFYSDFSDAGQPQTRKDDALNVGFRTKSSLLDFTYQDVSLEGQGSTSSQGDTTSENWLRSVSCVNYSEQRE